MLRIVPIFILTVFGFSLAPLMLDLPSIAHRQQTMPAGQVGAMIHLDPNDSPHAGHPSQTWFMLTNPDGNVIPPSDCNCRVTVYDLQGTAIMSDLPLSSVSIHGQQAISTSITFPDPGSYTVVLSGQSQNNSFEPFELRFAVTAVNPNSDY
jgi:hypothetical protein